MGCRSCRPLRQARPVSIRRCDAAGAACPATACTGCSASGLTPPAPTKRPAGSPWTPKSARATCAWQLGGRWSWCTAPPSARSGVAGAAASAHGPAPQKHRRTGRLGQQVGVRYAFENLPGYHALGCDVAELANCWWNLRRARTRACASTAARQHGGRPLRGVEAVRGRAIYTHISDNDGTEDSIACPAEGTIEFDALCAALHREGYEGTFMLECFQPGRAPGRTARRRLRKKARPLAGHRQWAGACLAEV